MANEQWWLVFGSKKRPVLGGSSYLDWGLPIGVYKADDPNDACLAAAKDSNDMGTFAAINAFVWGVELVDTKASQLGRTPTADQRMAQLLERSEERQDRIERLLLARSSDSGESENGDG